MEQSLSLHPQLRVRLAFVAAAVIALLVLVVLAPGPSGTVWASRLEDAAHAPTFGCVAVLLLLGVRGFERGRRTPLTLQYAVAFVGAVTLGIASEAAQMPVGRDPSWSDARNDALGALTFLLLFSVFDPGVQAGTRRTRALRLIIAIALLIHLAAPMLRTGYQYALRARQFPAIVDFTQHRDTYFVNSVRTRSHYALLPEPLSRTPGERALRVRFSKQQYPGIDLHEPAPDWSGYERLLIDLSNPTAEPMTITVRVHDRAHNQEFHDRYNRSFVVAPLTRETLRIPLADIERAPRGRTMDLERISAIIIFAAERGAAREMYLSRVWLE